MSSIRTINSPGIQITELDNSAAKTQNNKIDYSIVKTISLINGFSDKGEDYNVTWINSAETLINEYGYPTNEAEKYFFNACAEVLNRGGLLVTGKLPYNNLRKDKYCCSTYTVSNINKIEENNKLYDLKLLDNNLTSYIEISLDTCKKITLETLDNFRTNVNKRPNTINIVDITRNKYSKASNLNNKGVKSKFTYLDANGTVTNDYTDTNDCLGIVPVIVTPANALVFQHLLKLKNDKTKYISDSEINNIIDKFNCIKSLTLSKGAADSYENDYISVDKDFNEALGNLLSIKFKSKLDDYDMITNSISKIATDYFPEIIQMYDNAYSNEYYKHIGIIVFNAYVDKANNNYITFEPIESFFGSLSRTATDQITKKSIFIDNIVNGQSHYINVFSNINQNLLNAASIVSLDNIDDTKCDATSLGFYEYECKKIIDYTESIVKPLNIIFNKLSNKNVIPLDIVCDAGVSTIAQFVYSKTISLESENKQYYYDFTNQPNIGNEDWKITDGTTAWKSIIQKYDDFVKSTRRDCIFLADAVRTFCLLGNEKLVRSTKLRSNIENTIIPNLNLISGVNSNYSAGYCNWYLIPDAYNNDLFWCPPSIKAMGILLYTDTYYNKWDAPAGLNRGILNNVIDIAFNPSNTEADKIYLNSWNYAVSYPLYGIVLEGQKTFQLRKTALDRINVRRLLLYLEKNVFNVAKYFIYEANGPYLRQRFIDAVRPILEYAKNGNGISDYYIKCDEENNPANVVDNNAIVCEIAIKPIKTLEFIILTFNCTSQSVDVKEALN